MDIILLIGMIVLIVKAFKGKYYGQLARLIAIVTTIIEPLAMIALVSMPKTRTYIMFDMIISFPILLVGTHLDNLTKYISKKNDYRTWKIDWDKK